MSTPHYNRGQSVWLKRRPLNEAAMPDAEFVRPMGVLNGQPVCEITYRGKPWTVRYSEISGDSEEFARKLKEQIDSKTLLGQYKKDLALALGISTSTLNRR